MHDRTRVTGPVGRGWMASVMSAAWVLVAIASACTASAPADVTVTDSAGIEIVTTGAGTLASLPTRPLGSEPLLLIESDEQNDLILFQIARPTFLEDGRIVAVMGNSQEVLVFSPEGDLLQRFGSVGDGPGEFRFLASVIGMGGDSIGVYDTARRRLSVFDGIGELVREESWRDAYEGSGTTTIAHLGRDRFAFVVNSGFSDDPQDGVYRPESEWLVLDRDGTRVGSLGLFPGSELFANEKMAGSPIFAAWTAWKTEEGALWVGLGVDPEIRLLDETGVTQRLIRWAHEPEPATEAMVEAFFEAGLSTLPESGRAQVRSMLEAVPVNETLPPHGSLLTSPDGHLWVSAFDGVGVSLPELPHPSLPWLIFNPDGIAVAHTQTPEGFRPTDLRDDEILGIFTDDLGVESIRVYRVHPPEDSGE